MKPVFYCTVIGRASRQNTQFRQKLVNFDLEGHFFVHHG
ncbi:MAG: extradiol dioxygenase family protein [Bacteriovoracaceae bacterium]|jgi:hypothetical protein